MIKSLIDKLSEKDIEAIVNVYTLSEFYFPTLFPLKFTPTLKWESLEADFGAPVAGDVVSWDSRAPRKRREIVSKLNGDIPKISIAREKTESQMNYYNNLKRYTDSAAKTEILNWIWEDQKFCFDGVNARLEWLALRAASTGKVVLTNANNDGIVTESNVDFLIPTANKKGATVAITMDNAATSKPIKDIRAVVKLAKDAGKKLNYIFTDQETIDAILASAETVSFVAPYIVQALNLNATLSLAQLNTALKAQGLPVIGLVESFIQIEIKGVRTPVNPWESGVMLFSEMPVLGNTAYSRLADEDVESSVALKYKRDHVLIKRYAVEEPLTEVCLAMANAFPVLNGAKSKWLLDATHTTWTR
ncbi:major capsid protein [Emticicia sp. BO119]|uniref:major capsid protein n=1 Tax=Emticicia sp. BO119 TaxID=2757768 RepID=UPI0015F08C82|nr:major capsid protein [Emticicia sp. BO119]MBA4852073.1 major capsid protein [Emticicia sp. BO119]